MKSTTEATERQAKVDGIVDSLLSLSTDELDEALEELNRRRRVKK